MNDKDYFNIKINNLKYNDYIKEDNINYIKLYQKN